MKSLLILFPILFLLFSCKDCEDFTEPTLNVDFENYDQFENYQYYTCFYGIGGKDTLPMDGELPIAINSDTSTYILFNEQLVDTLSICYHRTFKYSGEICGVSIILDSFKLLNSSTFDSVIFYVRDSSYDNYMNIKRNTYEILIYY
jgi:hypothetical protein